MKDECMTCVLQNKSINFAARIDRAARVLVLGKDLIVREIKYYNSCWHDHVRQEMKRKGKTS